MTWHAPAPPRGSEDFAGDGAEPLRGRYFNDLIIEKCSASEILDVVAESMLEFSVVNAVTALHRVAKAPDGNAWRRDPRIKYLNRRITKMFASAKTEEIEKRETGSRLPGNEWVYYIDTRSLTNAAWAFAHLSLRDDDLMEAVSEEVCKKIVDSNAQQIAILTWSLAKMQRPDLPLLQTLAEETARRIAEFNSQHLMNFIWGCAKLKFLHIGVMSGIAHIAMSMIDDFTPQHLSITAWAFATLGFRHLGVMEALAREIEKTLRAFRPQNIANAAWAYTTLELRNERLMDALANAALPRLHEYSQQNLTNLLWSFSTLRLPQPRFFAAAAEQIVQRVEELDAQGMSMAAAAFAALGLRDATVFDAIAASAVQRIEIFSPRDLENIAFSYASLALDHAPLFAAVAAKSHAKLPQFTSLDLAAIAWSFGAVGRLEEPLMNTVAARAVAVIVEGSFPSLALANITWGFRALGIEHEALFRAVSDEVVRKIDRLDLKDVVTLLDAALPCQETLARRVGAVAYHLLCAMPSTPEGWRSEAYRRLVVGLKTEHLGEAGMRHLFVKLGIGEAPAAFCARAAAALPDLCSSRGAAFVEYELGGRAGTLLREDAEAAAAPARWLCAVGPLRGGSHMDRALRAEFLVLEELCALALDDGGGTTGARIAGHVRLFATSRPCLSCVGAMAQFRQLLPSARLEVASVSADSWAVRARRLGVNRGTRAP
eukprot:NODE_1076_length_2618_cov_14.034123.p1 GENE.NODE_1076_length_2618_cov_14.034123~~NODE_1076_length_2618_cov_14.034123.p1  ORF type:complete len:800 (-),score=267.95 NODE_1076_length_2618_cov_14.034123:217-2358(-)